ncbi:hypothetical protein QIH87_47490 [Bradyrhizobium elkanii]|uniref:hypothetical protein n=1 Tax=Bradyrhizobium elkanii TaxID=29448 RepID=UPI0027150B5C|nr:hypothetical protein [Bradyrhizobium elkanii]WLB09498.1 hypothetical protein QIH87_47490 [Bradyrhizobium elkanii]WLB72555.1 hypothetical protein QIH89_00835 [Bradyrhizobium elkanii]
MIVGHNHRRLEKRIAAALLSGMPYPREAIFLQQMSRRILRKGNDASLSHRQAAWLFAILNRCEKKTSPPKRPAPALSPPNAQPKPEGPKPFNIEECFIESQPLPQHPPTQPDPIVPSASTQPAQAPAPVGTREPDITSIFRRVLARSENFRKRRERIERQRLRSSSTSSSC